jgi:DNA-binding CsgD family transcriptional regulator
MTQARNLPNDEPLARAGSPDSPAEREDAPPGPLATGIPALIFLFIAVSVVADAVSDLASGTGIEHLVLEIFAAVLALAGFGFMWRMMQAAIRRAGELQVALDGTRADLRRWRGEAQELLLGLGAAIDRQFERWGLSPAEREVGLLLLKGLSLKEVAGTRSTSERTVRQQALAVYRKAGLTGRAELAAFFLEDLLLPRTGSGERVAPAAQRG